MMKFDSKALSSCYINFLFGAGVNGNAFPQVAQFSKTLAFMKDHLNGENGSNRSFEELFDALEAQDKTTARSLFINEFTEKLSAIDLNSTSISNLNDMFQATYKLVYESENRMEAMKQVNVFTLNYDLIVENSLASLGYLCNYVSASNLQSHERFFSIVGRDYSLHKNIPTFLVSKIHGDINNPVLPGADKYDSILMANKFEVVFQMKEKLSRYNSILFVIGYSGRDEHINRILKDCIPGGLTIYWLKYRKEDYVPEEIANSITVIENEEGCDTTALLAKMLKELWVE